VLGEDEGLEVVGHGRVVLDGYAHFVAPLEVVGPASLSELRRALLKVRYTYETVWITEMPAAQFDDPDYAPREDVEIHANRHDQLLTACGIYVPEGDEEPDPREIERVAAPLLARAGAERESIATDEQGGVHLAYVFIKFKNDRGRTVHDLYKLAKDMLELLRAAEGGTLVRETTLDLLRAGKVDLLLGQAENNWIEAKGAPYADNDVGKLELAKDVAAFANAAGGLLVLGVATAKRGDRDVLTRVQPIPFAMARPSSLRRIIDHRVHPPVQGLEVIHVPYGGKADGVVVVSVPPQPEEMQPFLVRGAVTGGRLSGSFVSVVTRRGEDTLATDVASIHALLAAGRAALRTRRRRRQP
jgi:Putative DNA-binding domain